MLEGAIAAEDQDTVSQLEERVGKIAAVEQRLSSRPVEDEEKHEGQGELSDDETSKADGDGQAVPSMFTGLQLSPASGGDAPAEASGSPMFEGMQMRGDEAAENG